MKNCTNCKKYFTPKKKSNKNLFCSQTCYWASLVGKRSKRKNGKVVSCLYCKNSFYINLYRVKTLDQGKYCSKTCYWKNKHDEPWNKNLKGIHLSPQTEFKSGIRFNESTEFKRGESPWNKNLPKNRQPNWKGGITPTNNLERIRFYKTILVQVLIRDNYTCQMCGSRGDLQVDHIQPWSEYVELRFDINNCRTLCRHCHYLVTYNRKMPKNSRWGLNFKIGQAK